MTSYADDTAILFEGSTWEGVFDVANSDLGVVRGWLMANGLGLNVGKTKYIAFSPTLVGQPDPMLTIKIHVAGCGGDRLCVCDCLEPVKNIKYLGVIVDSGLKFGEHANYVKKRLEVSCHDSTILETH